WLAHALATAAARLGGIEELLAGRPGSWEADLVRQLVAGTVGWDGEYLADYGQPLLMCGPAWYHTTERRLAADAVGRGGRAGEAGRPRVEFGLCAECARCCGGDRTVEGDQPARPGVVLCKPRGDDYDTGEPLCAEHAGECPGCGHDAHDGACAVCVEYG